MDSQGRQIYRLGGIGNNQGDANRVASNWAREAGIRGEISVVPEMTGQTDEEFNTWEIRSDDGEVLDTLSIGPINRTTAMMLARRWARDTQYNGNVNVDPVTR